MMKKYVEIGLLVAGLFWLSGCQEEEQTFMPTEEPLTVAEGKVAALDLEVKVYADQALFVGYNALEIALVSRDIDQTVEDFGITLMPMMKMATMEHTTPVIVPANPIEADRILRDVIFVMPSGDMGTWELTLTVQELATGKEGTLTLPITVEAPEEARLQSFISAVDSSSIFLALKSPMVPKVGINTLEFAAFQRKSMMDFPLREDLILEIDPQMPTMGHGSPDNVHPVVQESGLYLGEVNFTMGGYWELNVAVKDSKGALHGNTLFKFNL